MNSCILMAQIVQEPQLRYTADQMAIAEMLVEFSQPRTEEPLSRLKVVGWGNLAQEIQKTYHQGDRVIIEGRLSMNTVQLEGYKEKRAELTVQRIYPLGADVSIGSATATTDSELGSPSYEMRSPATAGSYTSTSKADNSYDSEQYEDKYSNNPPSYSEPVKSTSQPDYSVNNADVDDIPF
ncbi:single-stranded DNA-binding protein [Aliterella atlantica]|uniref:Single-stranded DNA-binding protein n=1 Tax=Aliterella atlantica CENA595 TaxID=1618023 RepID=A0A0D8ZTD1_9CYAN|nr:single-stranded DNA-binding protein [Aliterella atlantica]KJH70496.1 hypothetical protein UH38_17945 [Aliterella atlantica CENA595]